MEYHSHNLKQIQPTYIIIKQDIVCFFAFSFLGKLTILLILFTVTKNYDMGSRLIRNSVYLASFIDNLHDITLSSDVTVATTSKVSSIQYRQARASTQAKFIDGLLGFTLENFITLMIKDIAILH